MESDGRCGEESGELAPQELARFRFELLLERSEMQAQTASLTRQFEDFVESSAFTATDDEHDPDGSTIAFERAKVAALRSQMAGHLNDIDHALERLDSETFGLCERCGRPIGRPRLEARPRSGLCILCAAKAPD